VGSSSWPCPTRVAVHFAPARPRTRGTTIARPDLHAALRGSVRDEGFVLAYFRDGDRHGILRRLAARGERVVAFTHAEVPEGVERHAPSTAGFADHLRRCRAVVGSAGNHLPAEAAMLAKRFLALYRRGDVEQRANAALWRAAKLGPAACFDAVEEDVLTRWLEGPAPDGSAVRAMTPASAAIAAAVERLAVERTVKFQVRYEGRPILSL
ncbi:MAG: glycosyltransferase family protein, partial [Myxococcota bacterium]